MTYGDDGEKIPTVWNVTPAHGSIYAGVEPAGLFRSDDGGKTWTHVHGAARPPEPPGSGLVAGRRRPDLPHDRPPPDRRRPDVDRDQRRRHVRDRGRRADLGAAQQGRPGRLQPADPQPETGQCVHKLVMAAGEPETPLPAEPLRRVPLVRRRPDVGRDRHGAVVGVRVRDGHPSARRGDRLGHPAEPPRGGPGRARRRAGGLADARPRRHLGAPGERPAAGERLRRRSCARRCPRTAATRPGVYFGTSTGQLYGSTDEGASWQRIADNLPAIWGVQAIEVD